MNRENMCKLIDHLDALDNEAFSMSSYLRFKYDEDMNVTCASPCCIAGHAAALRLGNLYEHRSFDIRQIAAEWLDLSYFTASKLFTPREFAEDHYTKNVFPYKATPAQAARVVNHLLNTGIVDWSQMYEPAASPVPHEIGDA